MCVTADKTYIKINPLLILVPLKTDLNTTFKSAFECFMLVLWFRLKINS